MLIKTAWAGNPPILQQTGPSALRCDSSRRPRRHTHVFCRGFAGSGSRGGTRHRRVMAFDTLLSGRLCAHASSLSRRVCRRAPTSRTTSFASRLLGLALAQAMSLSLRISRQPSNSRPIGINHDPGVNGVNSATSPMRTRMIPTPYLNVLLIEIMPPPRAHRREYQRTHIRICDS